MKITIINGTPNEKWVNYEVAVQKAVDALSSDHDIDVFVPRNQNINYCCGCFSCWVKNPGKCVFDDDMKDILTSMAQTNYVLYVAPLVAGFLPSTLKKVMDRTIPFVLPYIRLYDGECHHIKRYDNAINMGVLLFDDGKIDDDAVNCTFNIMDRLGRNFHAQKIFKVVATEDSIEEVLLNEIRNN